MSLDHGLAVIPLLFKPFERGFPLRLSFFNFFFPDSAAGLVNATFFFPDVRTPFYYCRLLSVFFLSFGLGRITSLQTFDSIEGVWNGLFFSSVATDEVRTFPPPL